MHRLRLKSTGQVPLCHCHRGIMLQRGLEALAGAQKEAQS
jgi:hypothetical protein